MTKRGYEPPGISDERVSQMLSAFPASQIKVKRPLRVGCASCGGDITDEEPHDDPEDCIDTLRARAEKAERDLQHVLDVGRQEYAEAYAAPIRQALDEERRQRLFEVELAREAIGHLRALIDAFDEETWERAHAAACAFLDGVRV